MATLLLMLTVLLASPARITAQAFDPVAYQKMYTPVVSVTVTPGDATGATAANVVQPSLQNGVSTLVALPLASNGQAASSTVTLSYGTAWAGQTVYVQPLQNGTCTATGAVGSAIFHHGFAVTLDATGSTAVTFQPPNKPGTYQVFTRLLNVSTTFVFVVPAAGS